VPVRAPAEPRCFDEKLRHMKPNAMHEGGSVDLCLTRERRIVSDAEGQALGGAPWLQNDVRRAARCWLPTRERPRRRRQHGSGRCHLARRDRGKNDHMNCEGANGPDLPLKEYRSRREWRRGAGGA